MAYTKILYHIIFRTKSSEKTIPLEQAPELYRYIWGIVKNKKCFLYRINGMEEHIHILLDLHPSVALANLIKSIKVASSKWMKKSELFPDFKGWGIKYCALTYSLKEKDVLINYIKNQQSHHRTETFQDEIHRLWKEGDFEDDIKWFWVDS
ncbi:MAG: IS200/IS605 family transposase [Brumimicrobium sp.]